MAINLGTAILELGANVTRLQGDLGKATASVEKFARDTKKSFDGLKNIVIGIAGLAIVESQLAGFRKALDVADDLNKLSQKTGETTEQLSAYMYGARLSGLESEEFAKGLRNLALKIAEVRGGSKDATADFEVMGGGIKELITSGAKTGQVFEAIGERLSEFSDDANKVALAEKAFGKVSDKFIPFLNNVKALTEEGKKFGPVYSTEFARSAEEFNDNMDKLAMASERAKIALLERFIPAMISASNTAVETSRKYGAIVGAIHGVAQAINVMVFNGAKNEIEGVTQRLEDARESVRSLKMDLRALDDGNLLMRAFSAVTGRSKGVLQNDIKAAEASVGQLEALLARMTVPKPEEKPKPSAPVVPNSSAADEARRDALAVLKLRAELADKLIAESKREADSRKEFLDRFHREGLISASDYYERIGALQEEAFQQSKRAVNAEIEIRRKAVSVAKPGSERTGVEKELAEAIRKRGDIERQFAVDSAKNYLDAKKEAEDYANTVKGLDARILELRGDSQGAIVLRFDIDNEKLLNIGKVDPAVKARVEEIRRLTVRDAAEEYLSTLRNIDAEILEIGGDLRGAAAIRFETGNRKLIDRSSDDPNLAARLEALRNLTLQQASLNAEKDRASIIDQNLATSEQRIQNSLRVGQVTEVEALMKTAEARQRAVEQLEAVYEAQKKIVEENPFNQRAQADLAAFRARLDELRSSADVLGDKFKSIGEGALSSFFDEFQKTGNALSAFKKFLSSIEAEMQKFASREIASTIWKAIFGSVDNMTPASRSVTQSAEAQRESAIGGWIGTVLKWWSGVPASPPSSSSPASTGAGASTTDESGFSNIDWSKFDEQGRARAMGGQVIAHQPYLVGESRPEVFVPATSGRIESAMPAANDSMPAVNVNVYAQDAQSFQRSEAQVSAAIARAVARARRNT